MSFRSYDLLRLVKDFGEPLILKKTTNSGTYNPATGTVSGATTSDYSFTGYIYNYNQGVLGTVDNIQRGSLKCVVPALGLAVEPEFDDLIFQSSKSYNIISVVSIFSVGTPICYLCDIRL